MTPMSCACPDADREARIEAVPIGAIRCGCCGGELRLTCAGDCGESHVRGAFERTSAAIAATRTATVVHGTATEPPPVPASRRCARCDTVIPTKRGRPRKVCDACLTPTEQLHLQSARAWNDAQRAKLEALRQAIDAAANGAPGAIV